MVFVQQLVSNNISCLCKLVDLVGHLKHTYYNRNVIYFDSPSAHTTNYITTAILLTKGVWYSSV